MENPISPSVPDAVDNSGATSGNAENVKSDRSRPGYGCLCCHPSCLKCLAGTKWFLFFLWLGIFFRSNDRDRIGRYHHFNDRAPLFSCEQPDCLDSGHLWDCWSTGCLDHRLPWAECTPASVDCWWNDCNGYRLWTLLSSTFRRFSVPIFRWGKQPLHGTKCIDERQPDILRQVRCFVLFIAIPACELCVHPLLYRRRFT